MILDDRPSLGRRALEFETEEMPDAAAPATQALRAHGEDRAQDQARLAAEGYTAEQVLGDRWPESPPPGP